MKTEVLKVLTFISMVVVLGVQELLHGSWKMPEFEATKRNDTARRS